MHIVFLHIPKTAGQSVHAELCRLVAPDQVSPVRVHTQTEGSCFPEPKRYRLYSGHLDWFDLHLVPRPRLVFSIIRDPLERIASFFFFLQAEARALSEEELNKPQNLRRKMLAVGDVDGYFLPNAPGDRVFIDDHYDNFYVNYFGARRVRGLRDLIHLSVEQRLTLALANAGLLDKIVSIKDLPELSGYISSRTGTEVQFEGQRRNVGPLTGKDNPVSQLLQQANSKTQARIHAMTEEDYRFIEKLGLKI